MLPNQSFIFPGSYLHGPGLRTESQWLEIPEIFILCVHIYSSNGFLSSSAYWYVLKTLSENYHQDCVYHIYVYDIEPGRVFF